jgi:predicted nucleic acid-binding protein
MSEYFVLDCSITMIWCFEDESDEYSQNVLQALKQFKALVPPLWNLEVMNVLLMSEKRKILNTADSTRFMELLQSLPIYISDLNFLNSEIITTARNNNLTSYDAIYLLLAMRSGNSVATKDKALLSACVKNGVSIFGH